MSLLARRHTTTNGFLTRRLVIADREVQQEGGAGADWETVGSSSGSRPLLLGTSSAAASPARQPKPQVAQAQARDYCGKGETLTSCGGG